MANVDDHPIAHFGSWGEVRFFQRPSGERPAESYYQSLKRLSEQVQFLTQFRKITIAGRLMNEDHYRHLEDDVYEFKTRDHRMTCCQVKRVWFLVHGFAKKGQKTPAREIAMARTLRTELEAWLNSGGREVCRG